MILQGAASVLEDNFEEVAAAALEAYESGALMQAAQAGEFKAWVNGVGKAQASSCLFLYAGTFCA